jgi:hypothetical protein
MGKTPVHKGAVLHCFNRGVLGTDIFNNESDRWRFLEILRYKNHDGSIHRWHNTVGRLVEGSDMPWPNNWPSQNRLVSVEGYILMDNHFHLILKEIRDGGIAEFMRKLANSYISYLQNKYDRQERLFRGGYQAVRVLNDNQLRQLFVYILVKNNFDRLDVPIEEAANNFHTSFDTAQKYPFSSLSSIFSNEPDSITNNELFNELFQSPQGFKDFAKEQMDQYSVFINEIDETLIK